MRNRLVIRKENFPRINEYVGEQVGFAIMDYDVLPGTEKGTVVVVCLNNYLSLPIKMEDYYLWLRGRKIMKIYGRIKTTEI